MQTHRRRFWILLALGLLVLTFGLELGLRTLAGLGDPPELQTDRDLQYLFVPSRSYERFGNHIEYNEWSMRSGPMPQRKRVKSELRILVLGDSVINGGALTDQSELATELLASELNTALQRPVAVGNISAGSWGPENLLAYVERYGTFEADVALVVVSSHDSFDMIDGPRVLPRPRSGPLRGLRELLFDYAPRYLALFRASPEAPPKPPTEQQRRVAMSAFSQLIFRLAQEVASVAVVLHHEREELNAPGLELLRETAREHRVGVIDLGPRFAQAVARGSAPYRDKIHPNALGQQLLADALIGYVKQLEASGSLQ